MRIEVFSDVICPWCYVGHARLQQALAARPGHAIEVVWLPFELNPAMPVAGRNRREYLIERFGRPDPFADGQRQLQSIGCELGIDFKFELIERAPNTRRAHALAAAARRVSAELQSKIIHGLFDAYFTAGCDVGDPATLVAIAVTAGMPAAQAESALDDANLHAEVREFEALAQRSRITGVPTFIFDRKHGFSGAEPVASFLEIIDALAAPAH